MDKLHVNMHCSTLYIVLSSSVVRHTDICINNEGVTDKFRIQVTEHGQRKILGTFSIL